MIGALEIGRAARLLREVAVTTPTCPARRPAGPRASVQLLKCENLQRTGSFKVRGAYVRVAGLPEPACSRGVATASAGNHGKGSPSRPPASGPGRRCGCPRAHLETKARDPPARGQGRAGRQGDHGRPRPGEVASR